MIIRVKAMVKPRIMTLWNAKLVPVSTRLRRKHAFESDNHSHKVLYKLDSSQVAKRTDADDASSAANDLRSAI